MRILNVFAGRALKFLPWLLLVTVFSIPLSVKVYFLPIDLEVIFPAEPLIGICFLAMMLLLMDPAYRASLDRSILRHPITLLVAAHILMGMVSALFSGHAMVSAKAMVVRTVYIVVFFGSTAWLPKVTTLKPSSLFPSYAGAFLLVVLYTAVNQMGTGFHRVGASYASFPFYSDHTIYGAALVFVLIYTGIVAGGGSASFGLGGSRWKMLTRTVSMVLLVALCISFCRAAWLSAVAAMALFVLLRIGVEFRTIALASAALLLVFSVLNERAMRAMSFETVDSYSEQAGLKESVLSLTNVTHDGSNRERLNRWKCALRMFRDRPFTGFGPGTYQFVYVPYQKKEERTYMSVTNAIPPDRITKVWSFTDRLFIRANPQILHISGGSAHSEYLLTLSESGIFALLVQLTLLTLAMWKAAAHFVADARGPRRAAYLFVLLATAAYSIHGLFNNFLDDCKVAFLFWATLGLLVQLDNDGSGDVPMDHRSGLKDHEGRP